MADMDGYTINPSGVSSGQFGRMNRLYNNPHFDYLSEMLPRDIKDMFKWCEVVFTNTPVVVNGIKKLVNYPLTEFKYNTESEGVRKETKKFLEDDLNIREHLLSLGTDYHIYGNAFRSLYFPFTRFLKCKRCHTETNVSFAQYKMKQFNFVLKCGHCRTEGVAEIVDKFSTDPAGVKLVTWDPKTMDLHTNPITGATDFFYTLPKNLISGILNGNPNIVETLPLIFLDSMRKKKAIRLSQNFYHFKAPTIAGHASGWGISPLVPVMKLYMYVAILRKASEAIGMEQITPQRVLFPQATTNDPSVMSSIARWQTEIKKALDIWRKDPNYVMTAPFPTGVVNLGSQGKALMPTAEIKQAEEDMLRALDIPTEFVFGGTNINSSPIALRLMENQLTPYVGQITRYVNWILETVNAKYGKSFCRVEFTPFTLADDLMEKQLIMSLAGQSGGVSKRTIQETFNLDPDEERERLKVEAVDAAKDAKETERRIGELHQDAAARAADELQQQEMDNIPAYNQQKLIAKAQQLAQQLMTVPYEERKSYLAQLENEDYVMWALVGKQLEILHKAQKQTTVQASGPAPAQGQPQQAVGQQVQG